MPFIPSKERQKGELNFIQLIKSLMNNNQKTNCNINSRQKVFYNKKISGIDPYKPKGYNYHEYSREHPGLINNNKKYMKLLQELNKKDENEEKKKKKKK